MYHIYLVWNLSINNLLHKFITFIGGGNEGMKAKEFLIMDTSTFKFSVGGRFMMKRKVHGASLIKLDVKTLLLCKIDT